MQNGIPLWDAAEDYPVNARVMGSNGKTYKALQTSINQDPTTATAYWQVWGTEGRDDQLQLTTAFTTAGTAPNFTLTPVPAPATLTANLRFRVKFHAVGAGSDTLNINALGAKSLKQYDFTGAKAAASIAANQLVDVEYDGVDLILLDPYPQAGLSFRGAVKSVNTTSSLLLSDVGSSIELNANAITVTLPAIASVPFGGAITFRSNNFCTLKGNAAEPIATEAGPANTLAISPGETLVLVSVGSTWYRMLTGFGGTAFGSSKSGTGYQKLPGGLIIQWGTTGVINSGSSLASSFAIAFPTAALAASVTFTNNGGGTGGAGSPFNYSGVSPSSITITNGGALGAQYSFIVIGY
jgi:hypothetical protein